LNPGEIVSWISGVGSTAGGVGVGTARADATGAAKVARASGGVAASLGGVTGRARARTTSGDSRAEGRGDAATDGPGRSATGLAGAFESDGECVAGAAVLAGSENE
jgi:hypothetical protein